MSRLLIFFAGYLSSLVIIKGISWSPNTYVPTILELFFRPDSGWFRADSGWFIGIIERGYSYTPGVASEVAFFPLYPLLIKILSYLVDPITAGYLISNIAFLLACLFLYKLVKTESKDKDHAFRSVFFMLIFPTSFFASIIYSEGLFLFLSIASFYYARRKNWTAASLFGFFAALTKSIGFLLFIPLLIEYLEIDFRSLKLDIKKIRKDVLYLLLIPAGLFLYAVYLKIVVGSFTAFMTVQSAWGRKLTTPFSTLESLSKWSSFYQIIFILFPILALFLIAYLVFKKTRLSYFIYAFLLLFAFLSTGLMDSMPRYVGIIFPLYISMSLLAQKNKVIEYTLIAFSIMFSTIFTILFVNGYTFY